MLFLGIIFVLLPMIFQISRQMKLTKYMTWGGCRWFCFCILLLVFCACGTSGRKQGAIKGTDDLKGAVIGVQLGTTNDVLASQLESKGNGTRVERFNKSADAIQALKQGKIDCMVEDEQPAKAFLRLNPDLRILPDEFGSSSLAICVAKENVDLLRDINAAIRLLKQEGVVDSIVRRHIDRGIVVAYDTNRDLPKHHNLSRIHQQSSVKEKIRFATNAAFEPFEYYDEGRIVGIDMDVAKAICDVLGMELEVIDMEFDAVITSVQTGKADAGIAGITVTPERKKNIGFTDTYTDVKQVIIVGGESTAAPRQTLADKFKACFVTGNRYQYLLTGLGNTLVITFFAILLSLALGTLIAIVRATHDRNGTHRLLNLICQIYLTVVRGTPTMVQLLIIYYVVFASANVDKIFVAIVAFGLNSAAYISEVIRSGIMSVEKGQMEAGRSLGLSYSQTMRLVILPQAFKNVLPALGNELITLLKETSISGYIGLVDLTKGSDIIRSVTYDAMIPLGVVAAVYLCIVLALAAGVSRLEKWLRKSEKQS